MTVIRHVRADRTKRRQRCRKERKTTPLRTIRVDKLLIETKSESLVRFHDVKYQMFKENQESGIQDPEPEPEPDE